MNQPSIKPTGCCEPFNPQPWQEKEITWQNKIFVKDHVTNFLHIPLNFGQKMESKEIHPSQGISSKHHLKFEQGGNLTASLIGIPADIMTKIGGRDVITREIHPEVFNGSWPLDGEQNDN